MKKRYGCRIMIWKTWKELQEIAKDGKTACNGEGLLPNRIKKTRETRVYAAPTNLLIM
uniref:Uncharacterized protein n=1 Tax=Arion vulgaris TaxID=1028688 RepID=A0A0B6ZXW9_9EUPU